MRSPRELIEIYWDRVYNEGEVELIREVCADPIIRHDPDCVIALSHEEQISRVNRSLRVKPRFTHHVLHADDRFVTSVWNMDTRNGSDVKLCGIEVFEAADGRFTRCWNSTYMKGFWGEDGDEFDPATLPPPAMIETAGEITGDWFMSALAAGGVIQPQRLAMEPSVAPIGHGTSNATVQLHAAYNVGTITAPTDVICKLGRYSTTPGSSADPGERERLTYELLGNEPPFRMPRMLYGASDDTGLTNLIFEDLSQRTRPGDQIAGCSVADAKAVVHELAKFHRTYWQRDDVLGLNWLTNLSTMVPMYEAGAVRATDWLGDQIDPADLALIAEFGERTGDWLNIPKKRLGLIHSDARVDNMLFEDTTDGIKAWIIDWQLVSAGDPQYDVAYFLSGSVSPEDRRACERELVTEYAGLIQETVPDYSADEAIDSYRRNIVSGLWLTVIAACAIDQSEHNASLIKALIARNCAAIRDWDALASF